MLTVTSLINVEVGINEESRQIFLLHEKLQGGRGNIFSLLRKKKHGEARSKNQKKNKMSTHVYQSAEYYDYKL